MSALVAACKLLFIRTVVLCSADGEPPAHPHVVWVGRGVATDALLKRLEELVTVVEAYGPEKFARQRRNFGEAGYQGGHVVTYLHLQLAEKRNKRICRALWDLAARADREAGWNLTASFDPPPDDVFAFKDSKGDNVLLEGYGDNMTLYVNDKELFTGAQEFNGTHMTCKRGRALVPEKKRDALREFLSKLAPTRSKKPRHAALRCAEAIEYNAGLSGRRHEAHLGAPSDLSWHDDGHTLLTVAIPLSSPGEDFDGGEVDVRRRPGDAQRVQAGRGDVLAWRGWDEHRVNTVSRGKRQVIVIEWWDGPIGSATQARPEDFVRGARQALQLDPTSATLRTTYAGLLHNKAALKIEQGGAAASSHGSAVAGDMNKQSKLLDDAIAELKVAVRLDPTLARAHAELAVSLAERGLEDAAEASFKDALSLTPSCPAANFNYAKFWQAKGDVAASEKHLRQSIAINPRNADAHVELGVVLAASSQADEAAAEYRKALDVDPLNERGLHLLGVYEATTGREDRAEPLLQAAVELSPSTATAQYDLGVLYEHTGRFEMAEESYLKAVSLDPADVRSLNNLGLLQAQRGDDESALGSFEKALQIEPDNALVLINFGASEAKAGSASEASVAAEKSFRKAIELAPDFAEAHLRLGRLLGLRHGSGSTEVLKEMEDAADALRTSVRLRPDNAEGHAILSDLLDSLGDAEGMEYHRDLAETLSEMEAESQTDALDDNELDDEQDEELQEQHDIDDDDGKGDEFDDGENDGGDDEDLVEDVEEHEEDAEEFEEELPDDDASTDEL